MHMADSIGSLFGDGTDEFQLSENLNLQEKGAPSPAAQAECDKYGDEKFEEAPELEAESEGAFSPVPVASMNSFDPTSMVSVHLTPKNQIPVATVKVVGNEVDASEDKKKRAASRSMGAALQFSRALERLRALTIDEPSNTDDKEKKKRRKTGE